MADLRFLKISLNQFKMFEQKYIYAQTSEEYKFVLTSTDSKCPQRIESGIVLNSKTATTIFVSGAQIKDADVYTDDPQKARTPMLRVLFSSLGSAPFREIKIVNKYRVFTGKSTHRDLFAVNSGVHEVHIDGQHYKR